MPGRCLCHRASPTLLCGDEHWVECPRLVAPHSRDFLEAPSPQPKGEREILTQAAGSRELEGYSVQGVLGHHRLSK